MSLVSLSVTLAARCCTADGFEPRGSPRGADSAVSVKAY